MWVGEAAMQKSISTLRQAGYERISDLPRMQQSYTEKTLMMIPPVMRVWATSNGEQRVQVLISVVQGLLQKHRQLMQQYFELEALEVARRAGQPERASDPLVIAHRVSHTLSSAGRLLGCCGAAAETHSAGRILKTFRLPLCTQ